MTQRHQRERHQLKTYQNTRWIAETKRRSALLPHGLRGVWQRLTGKYRRLRRENEMEAFKAFKRDQAQKESLIGRQLDERQALQQEISQVRQSHARTIAQLHRDVAHYMRMNVQRPPPLREHFRQADRQQSQTKSRGRGHRRKRDFDLD